MVPVPGRGQTCRRNIRLDNICPQTVLLWWGCVLTKTSRKLRMLSGHSLTVPYPQCHDLSHSKSLNRSQCVKPSWFLSLCLSLSLSSFCSCHVSSSFWPIVKKVTLNRALRKNISFTTGFPESILKIWREALKIQVGWITVFCGPCQTSIPRSI